MAIIKSFTSLEQSKKLAEILPLESADAFYVIGKEPVDIVVIYGFVTHKHLKEQMAYKRAIPCWSLAALLDVLPRRIEFEGVAYELSIYLNGLYYWNVNNGNLLLEVKDKDNLVDACYELILKLNELKML